MENGHNKFGGRLLSPDRKKIEELEKFLPKLLKGGNTAAEIGSGPGYYSREIIKHVSKLYCVDSDKEFIDTAKEIVNSEKAIFLNENSVKMSIPTNSVDVVILANSFHDMEDKVAAVREINRILKKNGRIIVIDWKKEKTEFGPPFGLRMDENDYLHFFDGFAVKERFYVGPMHYGFVLAMKNKF